MDTRRKKRFIKIAAAVAAVAVGAAALFSAGGMPKENGFIR